ncbi:hypothetical protein [Phaeobacter sp. 22II1-1F12B]|uniref:hypothetical protein n=1 Tax=Phaeobacter sp. 22II1-1F12B TaxID=1317111 RepID=UPI000B524D45|nr:hypothetical protein [Phaeobacter sp. 22II1-1F12B]OWU80458.1 hypothetical protein ATO1_08930 [Phaeobacter sp. 22II1-1F12B]
MGLLSRIRSLFHRRKARGGFGTGSFLPGERARNQTGPTTQEKAWRNASARMHKRSESEFGRLLRK